MKAKCQRCGKPFKPKPNKMSATGMTRHCSACQVRNLFDGLGLPTPPEFLDRHTTIPALTGEEWIKKMLGA